ncbi:hypothetical protein SVIOM74S_09389 [Streptomyces violarus]
MLGGAFDAGLAGAGALLFGRRTWQTMAGAWPERAVDALAYVLNALKQCVVSSSLGEADLAWNNTSLIPGDQAVARIRELRETEGGDLAMMGSPTLVRTLLSEGLRRTRLQLIVMPVLLGGGKTIFPDDGGKRPDGAGLDDHRQDRRAGVRLPAGHRGLLPEVLDV